MRISNDGRTRAPLLLLALLFFVGACGGDADTTNSSDEAPVSTEQQNEPADDSGAVEADPFVLLAQRSDAISDLKLDSGGRLMLGVTCLAGHETPTALLEAHGEAIPVGTHKPDVEPFTNGPDFIVLDTDQPGRPAGFAGAARQTSFEAPLYTLTYPSLDSAMFELPGCP